MSYNTFSAPLYIPGVSTNSGGSVFTYDKGTWTPVIQGSTTPGGPGSGTTTYLTQVGGYTRLGSFARYTYTIVFESTTETGNLLLTGFPFASSTAESYHGPAITSNLTWPASCTDIKHSTNGSSTTAIIMASGSGVTMSAVQCPASFGIYTMSGSLGLAVQGY